MCFMPADLPGFPPLCPRWCFDWQENDRKELNVCWCCTLSGCHCCQLLWFSPALSLDVGYPIFGEFPDRLPYFGPTFPFLSDRRWWEEGGDEVEG